LLGIYTGTRSGALLALEWKRIDLQQGVLLRRAYGQAESKKRAPPVRLGRRILAHLRRWRWLDPELCRFVCHYDGKHVRKLRRSWDTAVRKAGLGPDVIPHTLRHTRATWLMQRGIDPWEASGHLGMSVEMLMRVYGHHHPDTQKRAAEV
jgi:integrase